jgi:CheY-like chemotaxis protein
VSLERPADDARNTQRAWAELVQTPPEVPLIPSIAVVEDGETTRRFLIEILSGEGYYVRAYSTVAEAAEVLTRVPPDLLIVDVELPDGSGLDLIPLVANRTGGARAPAIVVSGGSTEDEIVKAYETGAVDYVVKPFRETDLLARCRVHLGLINTGSPRDGTLLFGRYTLLRELGRGGYGTVYLARDPANRHELVALKVPLPAADDPRGRARFCREAGVLATIRHPNVVAIRDFGMVGDHLYCAMEYVEGELLHAIVRRAGALDEAATRELASGLLQALVAMEKAQVVHRDLKPANVILRRGDVGQPVLIDFGLARWRNDHGLTEQNLFLGTLGYAAPEVWQGREPDNRSDLFSLGMTLRFALTGSEPYAKLSGQALLQALDSKPVPPLDVPVSEGFAKLIASLCERCPNRRPPSASAALAKLESLPELVGPQRPPTPAPPLEHEQRTTLFTEEDRRAMNRPDRPI